MMLTAQMQSGKTGTFQTVARMMLTLGLVDRVFIISGSNEVELLDQAIADTKKFNPGAAGSHDARIKVIFRQHFAATVAFELTKTLVIVEESHLDQSNGQQMDKFLKRMGLSLNGELPTPSTYILSVSATPFSEFSALIYNKSAQKEEVKLVPTANYRGVAYFLANNLVKETFDLTSSRFADLVRSKGNKYNIIRTTDAKMRTVAAAAVSRFGRMFDVKYFLQDKKTIKISDMETAPTRPTLVFLKGLLRCGKVVPKAHIGFVWEGTKKPKTDTALQGLLGRMCGYYPDGMALPSYPEVYISSTMTKKKLIGEKMMNELERYVEFVTGVTPIMPTAGMNLKGVKERKEKTREPAPAYCFEPGALFDADLSDEANIYTYMRETYRASVAVREKIRAAFQMHNNLSDAQRTEIMSIIDDATVAPSTRLLGLTSQRAYLNELVARTAMGEGVTTENITNGTVDAKLGICYIKDGEKTGCVYVVFQLLAKREEAHLDERIAKTTSKEIFSQALSKGAPAVAGTAYGMTGAIETDPAAFERQLSEIVADWNDYDHGVRETFVNNQITAIGSECINLCKSVYTGAMIRAILNRISERFDCTITVAAGPKFSSVIRLARIEWTRAERATRAARPEVAVGTEPSHA